MDIEQGIAALRSRAKASTYAIGSFIVLDVAMEVAIFASLDGGSLALLRGLIVVRLIALLASVIAVGMWTYRANANLHDSGAGTMQFTPGWAVGWYFVPFANLFKPLQAMREIWAESLAEEGGFSSETPPLLTRWWVCWVIGNVLTNVNERLLADTVGAYVLVSLICTLLMIGAGIWLIEIIATVTAAQSSRRLVAGVFD